MRILILLIIASLSAPVAWAADCDQECASTLDCTQASCPVCIGHCVGCHVLGDQTACEDVSTGADVSCSWLVSENRCIYPGELPEMDYAPRYLVFLALLALLVVWGLRKKLLPKS